MSPTPSAPSDAVQPRRLRAVLDSDGPGEGVREISGQPFVVTRGIPRSEALPSQAQAQTEETFGLKWKKRDTFESTPARERREKLQAMTPQEGWDAMTPLTGLGIALGEMGAEIDVPEAIDLLDIPARRINVQPLFYRHVAKMFYHPDLDVEEMNHINYDWYAPANAARQSPEEVRAWCEELGPEVEHEVIGDAGITIIARKRG